jgi:hypothetical protein
MAAVPPGSQTSPHLWGHVCNCAVAASGQVALQQQQQQRQQQAGRQDGMQ